MKINYNDFWEEQILSHSHHPSVRLRNKFILNSLSNIKFNTLIDIGCGDGKLINLIKNNFENKRFFGIDISDKVILRNENKYKDVKFYCDDIGNNKFILEQKFDIVTCSEVIEHIEDWRTVIKNLSSITSKNGFCIITTQSGKRYKSDINIGHLKHFELFELENEFKKYNFEIVKSYKKGWPFYNLQKWLYEKIEGKAKKIQKGKLTFFSKFLFSLTYYLFLLTIKSKVLGPQIFIVLRKI